MPVTSRSELKNRFQRGLIPSQQDFENLIESTLNLADGNLPTGVNNPLKIGSGTENSGLGQVIAFFRGAIQGNAAWGIQMGSSGKPGLSFNNTGGNRLFIDDAGNVGIGTDNPQAKLQVSGGAIMPSASNAQNDENSGILFPKDPFGPANKGGDRAYIRYYSRGGAQLENMTLEIGMTDNPDDHIALMTTGNVGIGTEAPAYPLHIQKNVGDWLSKFENTRAPAGSSIFFSHHNGSGMCIYTGSDAGYGLFVGKASPQRADFFVNGDGNVGIGTSTPQAKFVIDHGTVGYGLGGPPYYIHPFSSNSLIELAKIKPSSLSGSYYVSEFNHDVYMNTLLLRTSDFTELFESENKTIIPIGTAVLLTKEGLIRPVKKNETPMGVISVAPAIICNNADEWPQKYLKNEFGQTLTEEIEEDITTPEGKTERAKVQKPILNPDYDPTREYVPRNQRPEWHPVGLLGQLHLRKGQPVAPTWVKIKDVSENVELWLVK